MLLASGAGARFPTVARWSCCWWCWRSSWSCGWWCCRIQLDVLLVKLEEQLEVLLMELEEQLEVCDPGWCSTNQARPGNACSSSSPTHRPPGPGVAMQFLNWTPVACATPLLAHWTCHHHGWCVFGLQGLLRRRCLCAIERQNGLSQNGYGHCQRCGCWFVLVAERPGPSPSLLRCCFPRP